MSCSPEPARSLALHSHYNSAHIASVALLLYYCILRIFSPHRRSRARTTGPSYESCRVRKAVGDHALCKRRVSQLAAKEEGMHPLAC